MKCTKLFVVAVLLLTFCNCKSAAETGPPTNNVMSRMLMLKTKFYKGTVFSIDVDNREYWITAKHMLTGATHPPYGSISEKTVKVELLNPGGEGEQWIPQEFSVIDPGKDVDIVVLAAAKPILDHPLPSPSTDPAGVTFGDGCEFLGFPYGFGWRSRLNNSVLSYWWPYVKRCTISALAVKENNICILDGINNHGFSRGPVIYGSGSAQRVIAAVSGYHLEAVDVNFAPPADASAQKKEGTRKGAPASPRKSPKAVVNVNSGFIYAYGLSYATDAIKANPIGPLRKVD
jgi:hypothetical protein